MFCCFSGHRPHNLKDAGKEGSDYIIKIKRAISDAIDIAVADGYTDFYCGMARGVDTYAAELVLEKSKKNKNINLHAAIPCRGQENEWSEEEKKRYFSLLEKCTTQTLVSENYYNGCMLVRNEFMVNNSQRLIAVWNGQMRGGTGYTVRYAKKCGKEIYLIRTKDLSQDFI